MNGNDKKRARLEAMRHVLWLLDYNDKRPDVIGRPDPLIVSSPPALAEGPPTPISRLSPLTGYAGDKTRGAELAPS